MSDVCRWCDAKFEQRGSGKAQKFCSPKCRLQFHAQARRCIEDALDAGRISVAEIKDNKALLLNVHVRSGNVHVGFSIDGVPRDTDTVLPGVALVAGRFVKAIEFFEGGDTVKLIEFFDPRELASSLRAAPSQATLDGKPENVKGSWT